MKTKDRAFALKLKDKILTEMTRLGLNGQRLARRSKVSDSEISRILSGQSTPGLENAYRLARAVGVSLDYLADDTFEVDPLRPTDPLSPDDRRVLDLVKRLGTARAILLLENINFIGYELAMQRLLGAKPIIEIDRGDDARSTSPTAPTSPAPTVPVPPSASRSNTA